MKQRDNGDRRDNNRRTQVNFIEVERRVFQRRSGIDRRAMLSGETA